MAQKPDKIDWGNANVVEPSASKKANGWNIQEKPPRGYFNWFWNVVSLVQFYAFGQSQEYIVISSDTDEQDYATLAAYIADSPAVGDKVLVKETQVLTAQMIIPDGITLRILDGARFDRSTDEVASVIKFNENIIVEGLLVLQLSHTGTVAKAIEVASGNTHMDCLVSNTSTGTITDALEIGTVTVGCSVRGSIFNSGGGTITNSLTDNSSSESNYVIILDTVNDKIVKSVGADKLNDQEGSFYQNAGNLNAGILPAARFSDTSHGNRGGGTLHAGATTSAKGFVELATNAETVTGTDTERATTAAGVAAAIAGAAEATLGAWASKSFATSIQAATDGFVVAYAQGICTLTGLTDASNPPTVIRARDEHTATLGGASICFPVKKDDYYKVDETHNEGSPALWFISMGA